MQTSMTYDVGEYNGTNLVSVFELQALQQIRFYCYLVQQVA